MLSTSISELFKTTIENNSNKYENIRYDFENLDTNQLNQICSELYTSDDLCHRMYILDELYKYNTELCIEHYHKINVQYMYNPDIEINEQMLVKIIKDSKLPIELKYESAKLIYTENKEKNEEKNEEKNRDNRDDKDDKINNCLDLLLYIASDKDIDEIHSLIKVQILQYLIESERNMDKVKELLYNFLTDDSLEQYYRYKTVLNFSENTNTKTSYIYEMFKIICLSRLFRTSCWCN